MTTTRPRLAERWLEGLRRPLAHDAARAQFWVRHLRIGVVLTMGSSALLLVYAVAAPDRPHRAVVAAVALAALLSSPLLLRLPMADMARDGRGRPFFYAWSAALTAAVAAAAAFDGGSSSLLLLFCLTLSYAAVAYPPGGVAALGSCMVAADVLVVLSGPPLPATDVVVPAGVLAVFVVMAVSTARNRSESEAEQLLLAQTLEIEATTDHLTGCLNRRALLRRLHDAVRGSAADGAPAVGLCLVDLDGFKRVNDTRGHAAGDALLQSIAQELRSTVRESDAVARLGGDEFAILTTAPPPPEELAERVRRAVASCGRDTAVTASVGVAISRPGDDASHLLLRADLAMYRAKQAGGDRVA